MDIATVYELDFSWPRVLIAAVLILVGFSGWITILVIEGIRRLFTPSSHNG